MALSEKQKAKAFALFPHVLAGMAVMLDVPGDEFEEWVRGLAAFPSPQKKGGGAGETAMGRDDGAKKIAKEAAPKYIKDKIRASQQRNPDCTVRQIADEWGLKANAVSWAASQNGIKIHRSSPSERMKARRKVGAKGTRMSVARQARQATSGKIPVNYPAGTLFYLRDDEGRYLHESGAGLVREKTYAWKGVEKQIVPCRKAFVLARNLCKEVAQ